MHKIKCAWHLQTTGIQDKCQKQGVEFNKKGALAYFSYLNTQYVLCPKNYFVFTVKKVPWLKELTVQTHSR